MTHDSIQSNRKGTHSLFIEFSSIFDNPSL